MKSTKTKQILFWSALISSWVVLLIFPFFWFIPFAFWVLSLVVLWIHRSSLKWWLAGLSAWMVIPFLGFCFGINDYLRGEAHMKTVGFPTFGFDNLDKEYRIYNSSSGCLVTGIESFMHYPNNIAVKICTKLFGYQKGVYDGFYPSLAESQGLLDQFGKRLDFTIKNDTLRFNLEHKTYNLLPLQFLYGNPVDYSKLDTKIVTNRDELLIVRLSLDDNKSIYLIDRKTGKNFAKYFIKGDFESY